MAINPSDCSVFIQIWVDTNAAKAGSTQGIYLVDNQVTQGSANEGTANLTTAGTQNSNVCFKVLNVDPQSTAEIEIANMANSDAYGFNGTPQQYSPTIWTGTLAKGEVNAAYGITLNITKQGGGGSFTTQLNPAFRVIA
jgi:hypothetical protein